VANGVKHHANILKTADVICGFYWMELGDPAPTALDALGVN
jgi:hypothetical protein